MLPGGSHFERQCVLMASKVRCGVDHAADMYMLQSLYGSFLAWPASVIECYNSNYLPIILIIIFECLFFSICFCWISLEHHLDFKIAQVKF